MQLFVVQRLPMAPQNTGAAPPRFQCDYSVRGLHQSERSAVCCRILVALAGHGRLCRPLQRRYLFQWSGLGADSDKVYRDVSVSSSGTSAHDDDGSGTGPPPQPGWDFGMAIALDRDALAATLHPAQLTGGLLAGGPPPPAASLHSDQGSSQLSHAQQVCSANCQNFRECVAEKQKHATVHPAASIAQQVCSGREPRSTAFETAVPGTSVPSLLKLKFEHLLCHTMARDRVK